MDKKVKISSEKSISPKLSIFIIIIGILVFGLVILSLAALQKSMYQSAAESSTRDYNQAMSNNDREKACFNAKMALSEEHSAGNERGEMKWKKIVFDTCERGL